MSLPNKIALQLRALLGRRRLERDMDEELRFHVDMMVRENIDGGMSPEEARTAALRRFGGVEQVKEAGRDARGVRWLQTLVQDLRYASRMLRKNPGFTLAVVLTLALGIGANTAIYSVVHAVLLRPLPYKNPEHLVMLWESNPEVFDQEQASGGNTSDWEQQATSFAKIGYVYNQGPWCRNFLLQADDRAVRLRGRFAFSSFFEVFGVQPLIGRALLPQEDVPGGRASAVLSYAFWQQHFGGNPEVLGKTLHVTNAYKITNQYVIVGVMPPEFRLPPDVEVWFSWSTEKVHVGRVAQRNAHSLWAFARLKPGVTVEQAEAEMNVIQGRIAAANPELGRIGTQVKVVPLLDQFIGPSAKPALLLLLGAVAFVLLIACANVANLLLARAGARQKEIAVRIAMGAGRLRVIRQLLTESVLLAVCGGALGVLLAVWGVDMLGTMATDDTFQGVKQFRVDRITSVSLDANVLAFALLVSVLTGVVFGMVPAQQLAQVDVNEFLKEQGRGASTGSGRQRLHNLLLVSEVAAALVLLVAAGVMIQSFRRLQQIDPGVRAAGTVKFEIDLDMAGRKYPGGAQDVTQAMMQQIRALPGVVAVGAAGEMPLIRSGWQEPIHIEGRPQSAAGEVPQIDLRIVTPGLFRAMGVPLLRGRDLSERDSADTPRVCLVNETFAEQFFPDEDPLGNRIATRFARDWMEIVGVMGDVRNVGGEGEVHPEVYPSYRQAYWGGAELGPTVAVRATVPPMNMVAAIRERIEGPDGKTPIIGKVQAIEGVLDASVAGERLRSMLLGLFAGVALVLAMIGVYGVMSWTVAQRTHEIGIRMALGADPGQVRRAIAWKGLKLTLCGIALGLVGAFGVTKVLASQLYGVAAIEPASYVAVPLLLTVVALAACYVPARRATRIDPVAALRHE